MSLGRVMRRYTPANPPPLVEQTAAALDRAIVEGRRAYADRIRNDGPQVAAMDREDDGFADSMISTTRARLEHWQLFTRPTFRRQSATEPLAGHDAAALMRHAERAEALTRRLFSTEFDATRAPYAEQAEYMLTLEMMIDEGQFEDELVALIGAPYYAQLRRTIADYKEMVDRRQAGGVTDVNLQEINIKLQNAIQDYMFAMMAMLRDDDPDSVAMFRRALGPVDAFRASIASSRSRGSATDGGDVEGEVEAADGIDPAVLEELVADQRALDSEIGLTEAGEFDAGTAAG